jgi:hypothetical protein
MLPGLDESSSFAIPAANGTIGRASKHITAIRRERSFRGRGHGHVKIAQDGFQTTLEGIQNQRQPLVCAYQNPFPIHIDLTARKCWIEAPVAPM